jgi:hypothetical protein
MATVMYYYLTNLFFKKASSAIAYSHWKLQRKHHPYNIYPDILRNY